MSWMLCNVRTRIVTANFTVHIIYRTDKAVLVDTLVSEKVDHEIYHYFLLFLILETNRIY